MAGFTDAVSGSRDVEGQNSKIYGLVIGVVSNNQDPEKLGRIKVKFPWLSDEVESNWCRLAYPMGGKERGFWWIPVGTSNSWWTASTGCSSAKWN